MSASAISLLDFVRILRTWLCVPGSAEHVETEMERNARTEVAWVEYVTAQLYAGGGVSLRKDMLTGMSAYYVGISVATVARHWKKYACLLGPFEIYRPSQGTSLLVRLRARFGGTS